MNENETDGIVQEIRNIALILGGFVAILWIVEILDLVVFGSRLNIYGIHPRRLDWLWGILFAPFLHGGLGHLVANTAPLLIFGGLIMFREISDFFWVTAISTLVGGLGTWLIGAPNSVHIGASGVVFGYFGFLLLRGYFERRFISIFFSVLIGVLYGSLIFGVLPSQPGISWEGHLFGFLGGILSAWLLAEPRPVKS